MSRVLAVTIVYVCVVGVIVGLLILVAPAVMSEVKSFVKDIPQIIDGVQAKIRQFAPGFSLPSGFNGSDMAKFMLQHAGNLPLSVFEAAITGVLIFFLSFYWLVATPDIHKFARSLAPQHHHGDVDRFMDEVGSAMGGYLRGVAINACIVGTLIWIGLHVAGIDYAFPLAVIAGLGEFIPYLGPIVSAIPAIAVAALQSPAKVIEAPIIYLIVMQIEGHVLTPNIMRSQTNVPQVVVIVALFAGGTVGGVLGALVAVPLAGAFIVAVKRLIAPVIRRWSAARFGQGRGAAAASGI
jgi:predicted PurR-regulated permease PerM